MTTPQNPALPAKTNILALIGFIAAFLVPVVGIVLGAMATHQLSVSGNPEGGRGLARWAILIGGLGTLAQVAFFIVWLSLFFTLVSGNVPFE